MAKKGTPRISRAAVKAAEQTFYRTRQNYHQNDLTVARAEMAWRDLQQRYQVQEDERAITRGKRMTTMIQQLRHRIGCVKTAVGQGYGERHSLEIFCGAVEARIAELQPYADECRTNPELRKIDQELNEDGSVPSLLHEHSELVKGLQDAQIVLRNPRKWPGVNIRGNADDDSDDGDGERDDQPSAAGILADGAGDAGGG